MESIIKSKKNYGFTTVFNYILNREDMSWQAKGLYAYINSLPQDWVLYKSEILKRSSNGRQAFDTAWEELEKLGYIVGADMIRKDGQFSGKNYIFYDLTEEDKVNINISPMLKNRSGKSTRPLQKISNGTDAENQHLLRNSNTTKKQLINKEQHIQTFGAHSNEFIIIKSPYINSVAYRINGVDGLREFLEANMSQLNYPEYAHKFMRSKSGDQYNDLQHLRNAYFKFIEKQQ